MMGRGGVAERLANPAFKMASAAMAGEDDLTTGFNDPLYSFTRFKFH